MVETWLMFSTERPTGKQRQITSDAVLHHIKGKGRRVRTLGGDYQKTSQLLERLGTDWKDAHHVYAPAGQKPGENDRVITVHNDLISGDVQFSAMNVEADAGVYEI
jgi:hypothetical protein